MLDGRVLGASQVDYKPFGKPPLLLDETYFPEGRWVVSTQSTHYRNFRTVTALFGAEKCAKGLEKRSRKSDLTMFHGFAARVRV